MLFQSCSNQQRAQGRPPFQIRETALPLKQILSHLSGDLFKPQGNIFLDHLKRQLDAALPLENSSQNFVLRDNLPQRLLEPLDVQRSLQADHALRKLRNSALTLQPGAFLLRRKPEGGRR